MLNADTSLFAPTTPFGTSRDSTLALPRANGFLRSPTLLSAAGWEVDLCFPADWLCRVPIVFAPPPPVLDGAGWASRFVHGHVPRSARAYDKRRYPSQKPAVFPLSHRYYVIFGSWETTWLPIIEASAQKNTSALSYKNGGAASVDGCQCVRQSPKNGGQNWKQFQNIAGQI